MGKVILFMHTTLDGFTGGPNGEMDWIYIDSDMFEFVGEMTAKADVALYGRKTYEMMEAYWPTAGNKPDASAHDIEHSRWYNNSLKAVLSRTMQSNDPQLEIINEDLAGSIENLKNRYDKNILIFGSPSASHALFNLGLIDEMWLLVNPVVIGDGIPLFSGVTQRHVLQLVSSRKFGGVMALHYTKP